MATISSNKLRTLRTLHEAFSAIGEQLKYTMQPDSGVLDALKQLVRRADECSPGVLLPFDPSEYAWTISFAKIHGLRACVASALSLISNAIGECVIHVKEQLLAQLEDLIRTAPPRTEIRNQTEVNIAWLGCVAAAIESWNPAKSGAMEDCFRKMRRQIPQEVREGIDGLNLLLQQARFDLRMETMGQTDVVVGHRMVFDYFDEVRKIIELARKDLLFVDPYLDAEFVSRYLPHVSSGVAIRLLAREKLAKLLPAVDFFSQQSGIKVEVRSICGFHDRYVFVDGASCYQSGASFKDGARTSPTTLTQITDAFTAVLRTYEDLWGSAKVER
jgi:hypothetical protein